MICANCGRKLKSIASKGAGYGPVCYKKLFGISLQNRCKDSTPKTSNISCKILPNQITMEEYLQTISGRMGEKEE